jgi:hypothetical protein
MVSYSLHDILNEQKEEIAFSGSNQRKYWQTWRKQISDENIEPMDLFGLDNALQQNWLL